MNAEYGKNLHSYPYAYLMSSTTETKKGGGFYRYTTYFLLTSTLVSFPLHGTNSSLLHLFLVFLPWYLIFGTNSVEVPKKLSRY